jgi:Asp-tRNA(Asn)/Glu-tRNA(Gln) amidotransferase C subunit
LRLSALEPPKTAAEEESMLRTLADQLHFVRAVQAVDTDGVEPLRALRDETTEAESEIEQEITRQSEEAFGKEEVLGKFYKRIRRKRDVEVVDGERNVVGDWDPVEMAETRLGKFFVVEKGKTEDSG